jgi:hypothetical protein
MYVASKYVTESYYSKVCHVYCTGHQDMMTSQTSSKGELRGHAEPLTDGSVEMSLDSRR